MPEKLLSRLLYPAVMLLLGGQPASSLIGREQNESPTVQWTPSLGEALKQAGSRNCHIIVHYLGPWDSAGSSQAMQNYAVPEILECARKNLFVRVVAEQDDTARKIRETYQILTIPTYLILTTDGQEMDRLSGYRDGRRLAADLNRTIDDPSAFGRLLREERSQSLTPERQLHLIEGYRSRLNYAECLRRIKIISPSLADWPAETRKHFFYLAASCHLEAGRPAEALALLEPIVREAASETSSIKARLLCAEALIDLRRFKEAAAVLAGLEEAADQEAAVGMLRLSSRLPLEAFPASEGYWAIHQQAAQALASGKIAEARQPANQAMEIAPFRGDSHLIVARIHAALAEKSPDTIARNRELEKAFEELWICRRADPWNCRTYIDVVQQHTKLVSMAASAKAVAGPASSAPGGNGKPIRQELPRLETLLNSLASNPDDPATWRDMELFGRLIGTPLERHNDVIPYELLSTPQETSIDSPRLYARVPAETAGAWREYFRVRRLIQTDRIQQSREAKVAYRLGAAEEIRGLDAAASWWRSAREKNSNLKNASLDFLCSLQSEKMMEAYVFLERFAEQFRPEFETWKRKEAGKIEEYVAKWLLHPDWRVKTASEQGVSSCMNFELVSAEAATTGDSVLMPVPSGLPNNPIELPKLQARRLRIASLFNQAVAAHRAGEFDRAIVLYLQCLSMERSFAPAHQNLAILYFNRGNLIQAANHAEWGTILDPANTASIYLATQSYVQLQLYGCAAHSVRRALQQPLEAAVKAGLLDRLAYIFIQTREWGKAEQKLKEATGLDEQNPEIRQHVELLKRMRSQPQKASP